MKKSRRLEVRCCNGVLKVVNADLTTIRDAERVSVIAESIRPGGSDPQPQLKNSVNALTESIGLIYNAIEKLDSIP